MQTKASFILLVIVTAIFPDAMAQEPQDQTPGWLRERLSLRQSHRRDSGEMTRVVEPIAESTEGSVVGVITGGRTVALGIVVSSKTPGDDPVYVVTKRSELSTDPIRVRRSDGQLIPARVAAVSRRSDLALLSLLPLEVDSAGVNERLRPIRFSDQIPPNGSFLVSTDATGRVMSLGAVGAGPRRVTHQGRLGVKLQSEAGLGPLVKLIEPGSGADQAGLELGDLILAINGNLQRDPDMVISTLKTVFPGEVVRLTIQRGPEKLDIDAKLREWTIMQETENDARVNGPRSVRMSGFDQVFQHDTVLNPDQCGGPVLDLDGRVVGMNIARAGRVVSYALPGRWVAAEVTAMIADANEH